jgi:hypothetical protein
MSPKAKTLPVKKALALAFDLRDELVAGDANKLFKSGTTADASGRFRKENGKVIGLTSVSRDNSEEGAKEGEDDGAEEGEEGKED